MSFSEQSPPLDMANKRKVDNHSLSSSVSHDGLLSITPSSLQPSGLNFNTDPYFSKVRRPSLEFNTDNNNASVVSSGKTSGITSESIYILPLLVFIWYITAIITITSTKEIMNRFEFPFLLCSIQFFFSSILSCMYIWLSSSSRAIPSIGVALIYRISFTYTLGFIFTNFAFSKVSPAFVETIKSSEPISTVILGLLLLSESYTVLTYLTLIPICTGVALSCYDNDSFDVIGFIIASGSNICFSARAVYTKLLSSQYKSFDEINLFFNISYRGLYILLPITIIFEGQKLLELHYINTLTINKTSNNNFIDLLFLMTLNGFMFAVYNLLSYLVLKRTELVTHSVLNVFRRVFIILFTSIYFRAEFSVHTGVGVTLAVIGVLLFGQFKKVNVALFNKPMKHQDEVV